jgi:hypothetical protein
MMRKILALLLIVFAVAACKKDKVENSAPPAPLVYTSLTASDTMLALGVVPTISAVATGDDILYFWSASYGSIIGSGATVQWTVCHADTFRITCKVKDKYDAELSKSVLMHVH